MVCMIYNVAEIRAKRFFDGEDRYMEYAPNHSMSQVLAKSQVIANALNRNGPAPKADLVQKLVGGNDLPTQPSGLQGS